MSTYRMPIKKNIIGEKFNKLTVIRTTEERTKKNAILYECQCECGNYRIVIVDNLRNGNVTRCAECATVVRQSILKDNSYQKISKALTVEGTNLTIISDSRKNSNNTSGYKGVTYDKTHKKWRAQIVFKGVCYNLGRYDDIVDAIDARINAEERLYKPILEKYKESGINVNGKEYTKYITKE